MNLFNNYINSCKMLVWRRT